LIASLFVVGDFDIQVSQWMSKIANEAGVDTERQQEMNHIIRTAFRLCRRSFPAKPSSHLRGTTMTQGLGPPAGIEKVRRSWSKVMSRQENLPYTLAGVYLNISPKLQWVALSTIPYLLGKS